MARPVSAFQTYPIANDAYADVRTRLNAIIRERSLPELGDINIPLWEFIHSCVPAHLELPPLKRAGTGINLLCREMILHLFDTGALDPVEFATSIRDGSRLDSFITTWLNRDLGNRAIAKKRALRREMREFDKPSL